MQNENAASIREKETIIREKEKLIKKQLQEINHWRNPVKHIKKRFVLVYKYLFKQAAKIAQK